MSEVWNYGSLAVYIVGYIVAWRKVVWWFPRHMVETYPNDKKPWSDYDSMDKVMSVFVGSIIALGWPVYLPVWIFKSLGMGLDQLSPAPRKVRKQIQINEQQNRIKELERKIKDLDDEKKWRELGERSRQRGY